MMSGERGILAAIVRFSIRFHGVVIAVACIFLGYGLYALSKAKYDVFPEFAPPQVMIQTEAPGLAPEQVEMLVTQPIENAINGVAGIDTLRSSSIQGISVITVTFNPQTDIYRDRQMITEQLASVAGQLPQGVKAPVMTPLTSSTSVVLVLGLTSETRSLMDIRTIADWTVKQRLLSVPGVSKVSVFGGEVKQLQVQVEPKKLIKYNIALEDVLAVAKQATGVQGAGFIENENQRVILQTEGQSLTPGQMEKVVVVYQAGTSVRLGDVAKLAEAPDLPIGAAAIMGQIGVQLVVSAQYGANTLEVTRKIETALDELKPALEAQGLTLHADLFRPANFIQTAIGNIKSSLLIGAVLVTIVLSLFLFNLRTAAISCAAIPLSLLAAITVLEYLRFSLNTMTLGGLAIAVGVVVDDAIIDVENILRRLRENRQSQNPKSFSQVVFDASLEVRNPMIYATLAVAMVFVPVLTMTGVAGSLFSSLGIAFILATLASLLVALTVTPALCFLLLRLGDIPHKEPPVTAWLKQRYQGILLRVEQYPTWVIGGVVVFTVLGLGSPLFLRGSFLPDLQEGHFIIHMSAVPGTSLQESMRLGRQVTLELLKNPYIRSVGQRAGRAEKAEDVYGSHYSEFDVDLKALTGDEFESAQGEIRKTLAQFPGVSFAVKTFLTERIEEILSGYRYSVVVNIFGSDLDVLDKKAQEVAGILNKVPGATDVYVQSPPGTPQLMARIRKEDLIRWGFLPLNVLDAIRTAYQGNVVGQIYEGNRIFDVSVILDPKDRKSIADVGPLPLRNPAGTYVQLSQLTDLYETSGRYVVLHEGARRVQTVTCNVAGRDINSFVEEATKIIQSGVTFPGGTYVEFGGAYEAQAQSRRDLLVHSLLTAVGIILMLFLVMKNFRNLGLVLINLPFALVGGVLVVFISGGPLMLGSIVGFVTLFGITVRNAILMISHYDHLISVEDMSWGLETAVRGASERLAPVLMTALVTALGLLPLAIGSGAPGREIEGPMAMVILGGLVTSTGLNLLVLPTLALRYGRFERSAELKLS